jgi:RNA polymerase sigma-70 factor, ECF subfamily
MYQETGLLTRLRAGDAQAFEALVRQYNARMLAVARRYLQQPEDCADAVQDTLLAAYRSIASFKGNSTLWTWLYRILVNACITIRRSRHRRRVVSLDGLPHGLGERQCRAFPGARAVETASTRLEQSEVQAQVRDGIARLPQRYREVLLLRDIEEIDTDQTAQRLGTSQSTVKTRLHRARQALGALLEPVLQMPAKSTLPAKSGNNRADPTVWVTEHNGIQPTAISWKEAEGRSCTGQ